MDEQLKFDTNENGEVSLAEIRTDPVTGKEDEFIPDENFSYRGYQIAREEFFAHAREPAMCICENKLYANMVCLRKAPDTTRVLIMISREQRKIVLKPCSEEVKDSVPWTTASGKMRRIICKPAFCALISEMMNWDLNNRYKMIGKLVRNKGERLFVFDLDSALIYPRKAEFDENGDVVPGKINKQPVYLETWRHQFGLPVEEHEKKYSINRFEDYVIVSVQDRKKDAAAKPRLDR